MIEIDAQGLFCPEPLMMAKAALDENPDQPMRILVDSAAPRDNISRLLDRKKRTYTVTEDDGVFTIDVK